MYLCVRVCVRMCVRESKFVGSILVQHGKLHESFSHHPAAPIPRLISGI